MIAAERADLIVREFVTQSSTLIAQAAAVVSMAGYNTVCEVLATEVPALVVPRVRPRQEQLVRAERLSDLGLIHTMHPDEVTTARLANWLADTVARTDAPLRGDGAIALDGLRRVPQFVAELQPASAPTLDDLQEVAS